MKHKYHTPVLLLSLLLTSCADEDMALVGALATGAAAGYAQANGNAAGAAGLLDTQQKILNEASHTAEVNAGGTQPTSYVTASQVPGKPGYAISPQSGKMVDVQGIPAGTLVEDPTSPNSRFRVPASARASGQAGSPASSASGITGTWSNANATWTLSPDGKGKITIPSTNQNGTATTYITYNAEPSGTFAYTITRATLVGSINCNGTYDYDKAVNKSYTETYSLNGNTLTIGTEVLTRN